MPLKEATPDFSATPDKVPLAVSARVMGCLSNGLPAAKHDIDTTPKNNRNFFMGIG
jgi:hypothetical protein